MTESEADTRLSAASPRPSGSRYEPTETGDEWQADHGGGGDRGCGLWVSVFSPSSLGWESGERVLAGARGTEVFHSEQRLQQAAKVNDTATIRELILGKVNLNARNSMNRTALHWAALAGHEEAASLLLDYNALVDAEDKFGMTPVLLAASHGNLTILQTLVKAGATVTARNRLGQTLLHCAALQGHPSVIRYVAEDLEGIPVDDPDQNGKTPLLLAAESGHSDVLRLLRDLGCDLRAVDKESNSALHLAARRGHAELLPYLMPAICSDAQNQDGLTPLHLAAQAGHLSCVQLLLDSQCQVNAVSSQHLSALHYAISHGHLDVCHLLMQEGIDVNAKGNKDPCLHLAVKHNTPQLVQRLLAAGCDINICDSRQQSALHVAVERRQQPIVELLLRANINLHLQDQQGHTALDRAVRSQHAALADMIIKAERFHTRALGANGQTEELDLTFRHVKDLTRVRSVLWTLATRHQKPGDWKKLAQHWGFSAKHIQALESQWTGSNSYKEHGYRMLLIWLHGISSLGKHPIKELYEGLVEIGRTDLAEKARRQADVEREPARRCVVM
ncbi:ankyrin repeat and death domain-containing protein 1A-like isoform X1 [Hypanus sabinus]|uniref:ankyrin repeat and death domain-containing protein 1A-like isoform X1 n=2 Tax=Hypanus sabinus TaxID=79690 RepID=UPI0028C43442|nr:ankyrin repeat and death domain-containing protein 1A-like isoform X1 [Hypanus sabinus]